MIVLLRGSAGLIVWSAGFTALYALHGLGCEAGWALRPLLGWTLFGWSLALVWLASLAVGAGVLVWSLRLSGIPSFQRRLAQASAAAGLLALAACGTPLLVVSACL